MEINRKSRLRTWLFNPFHYIAGAKALVLGLLVIGVSSLIGWRTNSHFDGVLDMHTGVTAPYPVFLMEGLVDWLAMAVIILVLGLLISWPRPRPIDVLGTQALARFPGLLTMLLTILPGYQRYAMNLPAIFMKTATEVEVTSGDAVVFGIVVMGTLLMVIWMVALMYRAYSVSCNIRGGKAIATFIAAIIIAEIISKIVLMAMFKAMGLV